MTAHILAADDDDDIRQMVQLSLDGEFDVTTTSDGEKAWNYLTDHTASPPDLVVLDVMMPNLDGFALLERLRAHDDLDDVPVVMLTSRSREEDVLRALEAGADDFLAKPFTRSELVGRVKRILD